MNNPADTLAALAPCPFCGGTDLEVFGDRPNEALLGGFNVCCRNPGCQSTCRHSGDRDKAIAAWNRRASLKGEAVDPVDRYLSLSMRHLAADDDDDGSDCESLWKEMTQDQRDEANRIVSAAINSMDTTPPDPQAVGEADDGLIQQALSDVNDAANDFRHAGKYSMANALVQARVTLYRAIYKATPSPAPQGGGDLADKVWTALDKVSCPGFFMQIAVKTVLDHSSTPPAQQPGEVVTDEMVERGLAAFNATTLDGCNTADDARRKAVTAALTAALAPKEKGNG